MDRTLGRIKPEPKTIRLFFSSFNRNYQIWGPPQRQDVSSTGRRTPRDRTLSPEAQAAGVIRDQIVWLGCESKREELTQPLRIIKIACTPHRKRSGPTGRAERDWDRFVFGLSAPTSPRATITPTVIPAVNTGPARLAHTVPQVMGSLGCGTPSEPQSAGEADNAPSAERIVATGSRPGDDDAPATSAKFASLRERT
jgi:hypothetical protein